MLKLLTTAGAVALVLSGVAGVRAEIIDMAKVSCQELISAKEDDSGVFMFWLHGYYGGKAGDTTLNVEALTANAQKLGAYCAQNPEVGVMDAVETLFGN